MSSPLGLLRALFPTVKPARPQPRHRLGMEVLEDRAVPAVAYGLAGNSLLAFDTAGAPVMNPTPVAGGGSLSSSSSRDQRREAVN